MEPNVYILFCLSPIPCGALRNRKKNMPLYLGLSPALLFDEGTLWEKTREGGRKPGPESLWKQSTDLSR
jgi:hypothetical protein